LAEDTALRPEKQKDILSFKLAECDFSTLQGWKSEIRSYITYLDGWFFLTSR
jgi:hypothetical protein